ncbi:hypothetical protein TNCV_4989921 [Trichonephila clavipes]|uniref:Uncharacterized protein n=1 Tax=Trichonephila clavipes TaxID=2585209 RepID=A0A8X6WAJ2_TRICX|nr:hypothetical protein TNCV_4989921 [Trichonephila clavipes]
MRSRAYCAHPSKALRYMSRCPDQVVSLKRDTQCLSPRPQASLILGTHLSTHYIIAGQSVHLIQRIIVVWSFAASLETEEVVELAIQINLNADEDEVQEPLDSHNQELTIDELIEMHEQEQDIDKLESLDPVQLENLNDDGCEFDRKTQFS